MHDPDGLRVSLGHGPENGLSGFDQIFRFRGLRGHLVEGVAVVEVVGLTELGFVLRDERGADLLEQRIGELQKVSWSEAVPMLEIKSQQSNSRTWKYHRRYFKELSFRFLVC